MDYFVWILVGLLVGTTFSITGVGGALISVPLFIYLDNAPIQFASVYALFAAFAGAAITVALNRRETIFSIAFQISAVSILTSVFVAKIKPLVPDIGIKSLYIAICAYSFWQVVAKKGFARTHEAQGEKTPTIKLVLIGISQGILMTLTGLGGGVILMPMLLGPLRVPSNRAVPTSCLTIAIACIGSIAAQYSRVSDTLDPLKILSLIVAVFTMATLIRWMLGKMKTQNVAKLRTSVYAALLLFSMIALALK